MQTTGKRKKSTNQLAKFILISIVAVTLAALLIAIFVLILAMLLFFSQECAASLGYKFAVTDEVAKAIIAVGGAVGVGALALYGVHRQNQSAEMRHKVDSSLALRKEIFLKVAEAASTQYQYLLSFASPAVTEVDRKIMTDKIGAAFFQLQLVADQKTISAMLEANEAWARASINIRLLGPIVEENTGALNRAIKIQELATPFMQKLWRYNMTARKEIECEFDDDAAYFADMDERFARAVSFFKELRDGVPAQVR